MDVREFVERICETHVAAHRRVLPARQPVYGQCAMDGRVAAMLDGKRLYSHQAQAIAHVRSGAHVAISAPTASGKTLIHNLPVLESLLNNAGSTALYLFPLKALAQNQLDILRAMTARLDAPLPAAIYDGDTTPEERALVRAAPPRILLTNPDMLHMGILSDHARWRDFLARLRHVIIDEAHVYNGVFGSGMACVFARLNRICASLGARPQYICSSATLGNAGELASILTGQSVELVDCCGAGAGRREFVFLQPRKGVSTLAVDLLRQMAQAGLRGIVFCQSRRMAELVARWAMADKNLRGRMAPYRAGYLPSQRRQIERALASGRYQAVVATSALELGLDIGGLDVCVMVGFPGSISQSMQRAGRVGRHGQDSAVFMLACQDALDAHFMRNPDDFFSRRPENAIINPHNQEILKSHLLCAASELPLAEDDPMLASPQARAAAASLAREGSLRPLMGELVCAAPSPWQKVNLRGPDRQLPIVDDAGHVMGTMDQWRVWTDAHPGAVYLHMGKSHVIEQVHENHILARPAQVSWYTRALQEKETLIIHEEDRRPLRAIEAAFGRLRVSARVTGFEVRLDSTHELAGTVPLDTPTRQRETEGFWFIIPQRMRQILEKSGFHFMGSIHALEHAVIGLLPLMALAARSDFGGISIPFHSQLQTGAVFVYDGSCAGLCRAVFPNLEQALRNALENVAQCPCQDGCLSCVHSPACGGGNHPLDKAGLVRLLQLILQI